MKMPKPGAIGRSLVALGGAVALTLGLVAGSTTAAQAEVRSVTTGTINWGVKQSFRNYITGSIAAGSATPVNGATVNADKTYNFGTTAGSYDPDTQSGTISVPGGVNFAGHHGILEIHISDVKLVFSAGSATLVADVEAREFQDFSTQGDFISYPDVVVADLVGTPSVSGDQLTFTSTAATLNAEGAGAFAPFYDTGAEMDNVSLTATLAAVPTTTPVTTPPVTSGPVTTPPVTDAPTSVAPTTDAPTTDAPTTTAPATTATPTQTSQAPSVTTAPTFQPTQCTVPGATTGSMGWGVKTSFVNYIRGGIAKGNYSLNGTTFSGGQFHWKLADAKISNGTGTVSYTGSVTFTGHGGLLDVQLINPSIIITSATSATLVFQTVKTSSMDGVKASYSNVTFATLSGSITGSGTSVSGSGLSATLTADGAKAFAAFYSAGAELDPISFSTSTGTKTALCDESGKPVNKLPSTGVDH